MAAAEAPERAVEQVELSDDDENTGNRRSRTKDPELLKHLTMFLKDVGKEKRKAWRCNYCKSEWTSLHSTKIKEHLAGGVSNGRRVGCIGPVPADVRARYSDGGEAAPQRSSKRQRTSSSARAPSGAGASGSRASSACSSVPSPAAQRAMVQSSVLPWIWSQERAADFATQCNIAVAQLFAGCGLPLDKVDHPLFENLCRVLSGGKYAPPGRTSLTYTHLPNLYDKLYGEMLKSIVDSPCFALGTDGWRNNRPRMESISNFMFETPKRSFFVKAIANGAVEHNAQHVAGQIMEVLNEVQKEMEKLLTKELERGAIQSDAIQSELERGAIHARLLLLEPSHPLRLYEPTPQLLAYEDWFISEVEKGDDAFRDVPGAEDDDDERGGAPLALPAPVHV